MKVAIKILISIISIVSQSAYSDEAKVCFYASENFSGESFCAYQGESHSNIDSDFNHNIESISIPQGMIVTIYNGINFSGRTETLKDDVNLHDIRLPGPHSKINSYHVESAVCFYTEDEFKGDSTCLASDQEIDLYNNNEKFSDHGRKTRIINNDSVKSIKIPQGMKSIIYENDQYNEPFFELTESINQEGLQNLNINGRITSFQAFENRGLICDQQCVISSNYSLNLPEAFGDYWYDERLLNKQILFVFNNAGKAEEYNYAIRTSNGPRITVTKGIIVFSDHNMKNNFSFDLQDNIDSLSFIIQIKNNTIQFQQIQTLDYELIDISPIISFKWPYDIDTIPELIIQNHNTNINNPLVLNKSILAADTGEKNWAKRDLSQTSKIICAFTPFLNLYNYIIQGTCNQLDGIIFSVDKYFNNDTQGKTLHIAGKSLPLKASSSTIIKEGNTDNNIIITYIDNADNNQSLSLPAAAKACMVSIHSLLNSRHTRQIRPACIDWTLEIMTDFTLLFGGSLHTWNSEYFGRIIDSIIRTGSTGVAVENTEAEKRLSEAVKKTVMSQTMESALNQMKSAFDYAQLNYVSYGIFFTSDDTPSQIEQLPLGIYELLLASFVYKPTPPTIIEHGAPVEHHELAFEIEILATPYPEEAKLSDTEIENARILRQKLSETIAQWGEQYQGTHLNKDTNSEEHVARSKLLHAGHIVTGIIQRRLIINRPGEIYVIVRLRGEIISIVLADRFNNRDEVELVASATLPDYVLSPHNEGTIRGAGTAAIHALAQYLQQQGARTLFSEVISQPSAHVKKKVGFNFKSEF
jgi:L-amino acid N-acyltransferase YncA